MDTQQEQIKEEWRPIAGAEDMYMVSNTGRIMSLNYRMKGQSKVLKPRLHNGYFYITLKIGDRKRSVGIHRLVAETFIPNPDNLPCVNHKDENPPNNNVENLEWCTYQYNANYGTANKRRAISCGIPIIQMTLDGVFVERFTSCEAAAKKNNVIPAGISAACRGVQNKAYGYKWRYEDDTRHGKSINRRQKMIEDGVKNKKEAMDKRAKSVFQYTISGDFMREFASAKEASLETGIPRDAIRHNCFGRMEKTHGYIFKYKEI